MISTIAVGTDGSDTAAQAVAMAAAIAARYDAEVVLLSAFGEAGGARMDADPDEVQWAHSPAARVREVLTRTREDLERDGVACRVLVDEGDPAEVLVRLAAECGADLLVIGSRGMQRRVLGSVPNTVTHRARCSVIVVKTAWMGAS